MPRLFTNATHQSPNVRMTYQLFLHATSTPSIIHTTNPQQAQTISTLYNIHTYQQPTCKYTIVSIPHQPKASAYPFSLEPEATVVASKTKKQCKKQCSKQESNLRLCCCVNNRSLAATTNCVSASDPPVNPAVAIGSAMSLPLDHLNRVCDGGGDVRLM